MRGILASRSVRVKLNNELRVTWILCSIAAVVADKTKVQPH
jgi:hypothetical protein